MAALFLLSLLVLSGRTAPLEIVLTDLFLSPFVLFYYLFIFLLVVCVLVDRNAYSGLLTGTELYPRLFSLSEIG